MVRLGMAALLQSGGDLARVVDTASHNGHVGGVDVAVYDLAAVVEAGAQVSGQLDARIDLQHLVRKVPVVGLTRDGREDLDEAGYALGLRVVVSESVSAKELFDAIYAAAGRGRRPMTRAFDPGILSERERAVLTLVGAGLSNAEIARQLIVSGNTVKTYIRGAYRKIGVTTRPQAVLWATRHRLDAESR
jgi:DNA-binding NarL/FixJ family response regulator